jgi:hypothetical protein
MRRQALAAGGVGTRWLRPIGAKDPKVDTVAGTRPDDPLFVAEAVHRPAEVLAQVRQVGTAEVAQLDALELVPDALTLANLMHGLSVDRHNGWSPDRGRIGGG